MIHPTAVIGDPPEHRAYLGQLGEPPHIESSARVEAFCTVDAGVSANTYIGERTWLMKRVHVGHDVWIGDDCEFAPGCIVGGHVTVGHGVRVGMGAIFRPFVKIGDGARIGCGAVVIRDVPAGEVWAGNPAKRIITAAERQRDHELDMAAELEWGRIADSVGKPSEAFE